MHKSLATILLGMIMPMSSLAESSDSRRNKFLPDYSQLQFAGNKGMLSACLGWYTGSTQRFDLAAGYGYAPASSTYEPVHKLLLQINYRFGQYEAGSSYTLQPFVSLGGSLQLFSNELTFMGLPDFIPSGYYSPNAIRAHLDAGIELKRQFSTGLPTTGIYVLLTTNDLYLYNYFKSSQIKLDRVVSLGIGLRIYFE